MFSRAGGYLAGFFRKQEEAAASQAAPPQMAALDMPHAFKAAYTQPPTLIGVDVAALCIHAAARHHLADTYAKTTLTVGGTDKACSAAGTVELLAVLNAMAPGNYVMHVNVGLATHKGFQAEDTSITKGERVKALRIALACMMMARGTMAPSGQYYQKHSPPLKLGTLPQECSPFMGLTPKT